MDKEEIKFDSSEEQLLNEYNALKERVFDISKVTNNYIISSITIVAASIVFSLEQQEPLIVLIGIYYMAFFLVFVKARNRAMREISKYIAEEIESRVEGLNWFSRSPKPRKFDSVVGIHSIIMIISSIVFYYQSFILCKLGDNLIWDINLRTIIFIITFIAIIGVSLLYMFYKSND